MSSEDDPPAGGDDGNIDDALKDIPTSKGGADLWGHEGRRRDDRGPDASMAPTPPAPPSLPPPAPAPIDAPSGGPNKPLILGVAGAVVVAGLAYALLSDSAPSAPEAAPTVGALTVKSDPPGAEIAIDGRPTGQQTDATIEGLALDKDLRVTLTARDFVAVPAVHELIIPSASRVATVEFKLTPARHVSIATSPPGASVSVDLAAISGTTPLELPPIPLGRKARVRVTLKDHLPVELELVADAQTATVARLRLEAAQTVNVSTHPMGAKISLDGASLGVGPLAVQVPTARASTLVVEKPGFVRVSRALKPGAIPVEVDVTLEPVPLTKLALTDDERGRAAEIERAIAKAKPELAKVKAGLAKSEAQLAKAKSPTAYVADTTELEESIGRARVRIAELEGTIEEQSTKLDLLRDEVFMRLGDAAP